MFSVRKTVYLLHIDSIYVVKNHFKNCKNVEIAYDTLNKNHNRNLSIPLY